MATAIAFIVCTLIWGSTFLFIRIGNDTVPPMWGAALRVAVAALVLLAIGRVRRRPWPSGRALRAAIGYGFFQFGINIPLLYWGETVVSSGMAAVVYATVPITGAIVARLFGLERLQRLKMAGALVALAGVGVLFGHQLGTSVTALPLLAIWLATVSAAIGSTLLKRGPRQDPIGANAIANLVAIPMCVAASFLLGEPRTVPVTWAQIFPILYLAVAGSVVAFVVFSWLVLRLDVSTVAFIGVVVPVIAVALGVVVLHEPVRRGDLLGSLLVFAGVGLAIVSDRRRAAQAAAVA